jgi:tRNA dimethylallyltransferase
MDLKSKIILISGPTASGKTDFSIKLAKKIKGEIINADSMQVYKELKILTARPLKKNQKNIKHHLYGFQTVKKNFSTGSWLKLVIKKINQIKKKNKIPIVVGGTGLYFKALIDGLVKIPNIPKKIRLQIRNKQKQLGQKKFYQMLINLDPISKNKINLNDTQRSIRAYEIKKYTKKSMFEWFNKTTKNFKKEQFFKIYIDYPRPQLINRINKRVEEMFDRGAVREVKNFLKLKARKDNSSNKVIGIEEISDFIEKSHDLQQTKDRIAIKTRQYAKRQSTWARRYMNDWNKIDLNQVKFSDLNKFFK